MTQRMSKAEINSVATKFIELYRQYWQLIDGYCMSMFGRTVPPADLVRILQAAAILIAEGGQG